MKLARLLNEQRVFLGLDAETSQEVMVELVDALVAGNDLAPELRDEALESLKSREADISTGVGCGVGLPHAYLENLSEAVAAFGRSQKGIEFASCDHAPVHFVVLMLIPEDKKGQHLLTLADIGRSFLSCEVRQSLNEATTKEEILAILARS
jgi:mannitol/fructose-specific phosphotransferase system IIA component (Ntr-type)